MSILTFWVPKDSDPTAIKMVVTDVMKSLPDVDYRIVDTADIPMPGVGEIVLAMGSDNAASLAKAGIVPKGRSVTSLRGSMFARKVSGLMMPDGTGNLIPAPDGYGHWMVSFAPGLALMEADKQPLMAWDVRLAYRYITQGTIAPQVGKYAYTEDLSGVIQYVDAMYAQTGVPVRLSVDLETMGLVPWLEDKQIVTISVTPAKGHSDVVNTFNASPAKMKKLAEQLDYLLNTSKAVTVGANLKYDLIWIRVKFGVVSSNFKFDTLLVGSLVNENRSNSLNLHAKVYTQMGGYDDPFNAQHDKGRMELALQKDPDGFLTYAGGDTDAAWQVVDEQAKELQAEPSLKLFYARVLHPAARAFENIEYRGLVVDTEAYAELRKELVSHADEAESKALEMIPGRLKLKHVDKGLTLSRKALISDFLFSPQGLNLKPLMLTAKSGEPKTDKAHLMMFREHPEAGPFIEAMNEWSSATKIRSTYVDGFLAHLRPDGRFHPTYMLFAGSAFEGKDDDGGTNTGRLSATGPAVQTIPKHNKWAKKLRKCLPAPPGMVFWQADFSQGELRIAADRANEETMLHAYHQGLDLHAVTGSKLAGFELEEFLALADLPEDSEGGYIYATFRQRAKPANFGLLYGMQSEGFREYARVSTNGKMKLTSQEAYDTREAFFALYSKLLPWHSAEVNHAKQHGWVMNPLGRIRHLPLIHSKSYEARSKSERQAINAPIQGCLSDMNIWAASIMEQNWGGEGLDKLWIAGATHDSIYGYCPEHNAKSVWFPRIVEVMSTLPIQKVFGWEAKVEFPADIEAGPTMGDMAKVKLI